MEQLSITVKDTVTNQTATVKGQSLWDWTEGNWSCDCNRALYFGPMTDEYDYCKAHRYIVVAVSPMPKGFTLQDFNQDY